MWLPEHKNFHFNSNLKVKLISLQPIFVLMRVLTGSALTFLSGCGSAYPYSLSIKLSSLFKITCQMTVMAVLDAIQLPQVDGLQLYKSPLATGVCSFITGGFYAILVWLCSNCKLELVLHLLSFLAREPSACFRFFQESLTIPATASQRQQSYRTSARKEKAEWNQGLPKQQHGKPKGRKSWMKTVHDLKSLDPLTPTKTSACCVKVLLTASHSPPLTVIAFAPCDICK